MALPTFLLPRSTSSSLPCSPIRSKLLHCQLSRYSLPCISIRSKTLHSQLTSVFPGQKLRILKSMTKYTDSYPFTRIRVQVNKSINSASHDLIEDSEHFLDDISDWISKKIATTVRPHLPENFDVLDWIPSSLHSRIHSVERLAAVFVRECLILLMFCFILARVGRFCQWLSRMHYLRTHGGHQPSESHYQLSPFSAMEDPLKAGLLLWQVTHMLHMVGPLFKLRLSHLLVEKFRAIGFIIVSFWFLFKWKGLTLQGFISQNKADAPRLLALDKVLSLLMYYIAGTCIGEVSGFALRSVFAIGGVSGIAVGLAAKEIAGNFLGGAMLFITRPFVVGDRVKSDSFEGWVEDIDFLYTKIRGYDQSPVLVPNSAIMNEIITNHSRAKCRQLVAIFILRNEDIFLVDNITDEIIKCLMNHPRVDLVNGVKPVCYLKNMSAEGLEIEVICSIEEKGGGLEEFFKAKQQILVKAAKIVTSAGACFETNTPVVLMKEDRNTSTEAV